jgi:hypothetical protein
MTIKFRPHHFLCALGFEGRGYTSLFIDHFQALADHLRGQNGDDTEIIVTEAADDICQPCPQRLGNLCTHASKTAPLDQAHAQALGVKAGDRLTWGEAKQRIAQHITPETFDQICAPCEWKSLGLCAAALERLHKEVREISS